MQFPKRLVIPSSFSVNQDKKLSLHLVSPPPLTVTRALCQAGWLLLSLPPHTHTSLSPHLFGKVENDPLSLSSPSFSSLSTPIAILLARGGSGVVMGVGEKKRKPMQVQCGKA